ncbi:hypothetical protein K3555_11980 [Leisingera sp. M527]|uniref:hypothetical protein n=1 Tax=Leisingera sp. M527 TaxID=2867014 RepID=UPI0021A2B98F|nr:hypothetical protein [Leisingera sp. M527]UWQ31329.1 hypothetical protein K3555_11980 [Leisingera sp. M527]
MARTKKERKRSKARRAQQKAKQWKNERAKLVQATLPTASGRVRGTGWFCNFRFWLWGGR